MWGFVRGIETVERVFFPCEFVREFLASISEFQSEDVSRHHLNTVKVGVFLNDRNLEFLMNYLIVLGEHFIHRRKYFKDYVLYIEGSLRRDFLW